MKKIFFTCLFLIFAPLTLSVSLFSLWQIDQTKFLSALVTKEAGAVLGAKSPLELYLSVPPAISLITQAISIGDARPVLIRKYLKKYHSPLLPYADFIFQMSEKYGIDYGLIVAIAQCESNVCKKIPEGSYNCWGFENGETKFYSWEHAIERVAQTLKEGYYDKGLITPAQIMPKYAPPSVEKGGPWARCVEQFLEELR